MVIIVNIETEDYDSVRFFFFNDLLKDFLVKVNLCI